MRIGIDTNVLLSSFFWPSSLMKRLFEIISTNNKFVVTEPVLYETLDSGFRYIKKFYFGNLGRKLSMDKKREILKSNLLEEIYDYIMSFNPIIKKEDKNWLDINCDIRDINDRLIFQSFIGSNCDVIVTGDKDFLSTNYKSVKIMTPRQFIETFSS